MSTQITAAFEFDGLIVPIDHLLPSKVIKDGDKRYETILISLREEGLLEPLMIYPAKGMKGRFMIVDGHYRHRALKELGQTEVRCLISTDDETFTYNHKVNRLAPIQENAMFIKAIRGGVKPERLAAALNVPLERILAQINLLDGLDKEVINLLKDKPIVHDALRLLKKVTPLRQQEITEILRSSNTYSKKYVQALLAGTKPDEFVTPGKAKEIKGVRPEDVARMEKETETVEKDFNLVKEEYAQHVMNLTVARGYVKKLMGNARIQKFLSKNYPDLFGAFHDLVELESL